jgi:hypothetical protein
MGVQASLVYGILIDSFIYLFILVALGFELRKALLLLEPLAILLLTH